VKLRLPHWGPQARTWGNRGLTSFLLLAAGLTAWHLKHPLLYGVRSLETYALLLVSLGGVLLALRSWHRANVWRQKLEPALRGLAWTAVALTTLGQEAWFRWQQYQVLQAGVAMERMGRHFVVGFRHFDDVAPLAKKGLIGGIYLGRRNIQGRDMAEIRKEVAALQALRRKAGLPPLFVMADQEGGHVAHLTPLVPTQPPLAQLLQTPSQLDQRARVYGRQQGQALAALGINMNLAPVVDLTPDESPKWRDRHTRLAQRTISAQPDLVARIASAYGRGLAEQGVLPTVKHFPGLGRVQGDTHLVRVSLSLTPEQMRMDWQPFRQVTRQTGAAMMLAHVTLPQVDARFPASMSRPLVQDLLRNQWDFQGLLITDDLNMGAAYQYGIDQAAKRALDAGVDLLLVSYDPDQYYRALYGAARGWRTGAIGAAREAASAARLDRYWNARNPLD